MELNPYAVYTFSADSLQVKWRSVLHLPVTCSLLNVTYIIYRQSDSFALFSCFELRWNRSTIPLFRYLFPDHVNNGIFIWCLGLGVGLLVTQPSVSICWRNCWIATYANITLYLLFYSCVLHCTCLQHLNLKHLVRERNQTETSIISHLHMTAVNIGMQCINQLLYLLHLHIIYLIICNSQMHHTVSQSYVSYFPGYRIH